MAGPGRFLFACFLLLAMAGAASAQGQPAEPPIGLSIGLRAGYAIPAGNMGSTQDTGEGDLPLSDGVKGMVPFGLDLGYRIIPHLSVGASLQYGFGLANEDGCRDCSIRDISFGAHVYVHAAPGERFDPWAGLGLGYERLKITRIERGALTDVGLDGFQFFVLQVGADIATGSPISAGPFFGLSAGKYASLSVSGSLGGQSVSQSRDLARTAWHQWVTLGMQGRFNL